MGLKEIASKLKHLEKASGVDEQERLLEEFCEIIRHIKLTSPDFFQRVYWPLVELTHDEIRAMGRGEKTIDDFKDRFKMRFEDWYRLSPKLDDGKYLHEIAKYNRLNGDHYPEWWLDWKQGTV